MVYGHGIYDGVGNTSLNKFYGIWKEMLRRCYSSKYLEKFPSYVGTTVCEEWKLFSNFEKWAEEHYKDGYHLDKDIISGDLKIYSPVTCAFVPPIINHCIKNRESSSEYPLGVSYHKLSGKPDYELPKPYCSSISKNGKDIKKYFSTSEEAHLSWQTSKIEFLQELIKQYSAEIDVRVVNGLLRRIEILQHDIDNNKITETINKI